MTGGRATTPETDGRLPGRHVDRRTAPEETARRRRRRTGRG